MQVSISFVVAILAALATVCATPVEKKNDEESVTAKSWGGDGFGSGSPSPFQTGDGNGDFQGGFNPERQSANPRGQRGLYPGGQGGFYPGGQVGSYPGGQGNDFGQMCSQFTYFQRTCTTIIETCQSTNIQFDVAIERFSQFCSSFQSITRTITSFQSFQSIRGTSYEQQFRSVLIYYTKFTSQIITTFRSRWSNRSSRYTPLLQRYCIEYQRVIGIAVKIGLDVRGIFLSLNIDLSIFDSIGLRLNTILNVDASVLIGGHSLIGLGGNGNSRGGNNNLIGTVAGLL